MVDGSHAPAWEPDWGLSAPPETRSVSGSVPTQSVGPIINVGWMAEAIHAEAAPRSGMRTPYPHVENRFASYEVSICAAKKKPPPDGSDGGFFLAARGLRRAAV